MVEILPSDEETRVWFLTRAGRFIWFFAPAGSNFPRKVRQGGLTVSQFRAFPSWGLERGVVESFKINQKVFRSEVGIRGTGREYKRAEKGCGCVGVGGV